MTFHCLELIISAASFRLVKLHTFNPKIAANKVKLFRCCEMHIWSFRGNLRNTLQFHKWIIWNSFLFSSQKLAACRGNIQHSSVQRCMAVFPPIFCLQMVSIEEISLIMRTVYGQLTANHNFNISKVGDWTNLRLVLKRDEERGIFRITQYVSKLTLHINQCVCRCVTHSIDWFAYFPRRLVLGKC